MRRAFVAFLSFLAPLIFALSSCQKERAIAFDGSNPLALALGVEWAVVVEPYAAFRSAADWNSETVGHCRKGDVMQVFGTGFDSENAVWYRFEDGWLSEKAVAVYNNRFRAQTAADAL